MSNYMSRYQYGVTAITHKGKTITTSIHTPFMDSIDPTSPNSQHDVAKIKQYVKHRPDTISDIFYNSSAYWWYILLYNNINDPFEGLNSSTKILIPQINVNIGK
tara:strand:- start:2817 stop:3128 length:312 start_codon:yes stop_codon:yes gene_type:complete